MKAEHRHELKTNELAEWIANLPRWAKENLRMIIIVSAVVVLGAGSYLYYRYQENVVSTRRQLRLTELASRVSRGKRDILAAQARGVDISFTLLQLADDLRTFAQNARSDRMAALALVKRAEALRAELHFRRGTVSQRDTATQIKWAKDSYSEALEKSSLDPSLTAMAKFGLGLCEEELGNFDKASQIYGDLVATADFQSTTAFAQARQRLETMADYEQKVVFRSLPKPKPAPPPTTTPPAPLGPLDANLAAVDRAGGELADVNRAGGELADVNLGDTNMTGP